jgi:hypothetical protein
MIKIIDDVLPVTYANQIELDSLHYIQYFWNARTVVNMPSDDPNIYDVGQMSCPIWYKEPHNFKFSEYFNFIRPMLMIVQEKTPELNITNFVRIKFNMLHRVDSKYKEMYNIPHPDETDSDNSFGMVYYVNDSDGDTVLFNEFYDKNTPNPTLTIHKRIQPKKNRLILFDAKRYHASSNPSSNESRIVINFVMTGVKRE